jgi:hypothetical protein
MLLGQNNSLFIYKEKDSSVFNLDIPKSIASKDTNKIHLVGYIFDRTINSNEKELFQNWLIPYSISKMNLTFNVLNIIDKKNYNVNIKINSKKESYTSISRSILFLYSCDTSLINFLKENDVQLGLTIQNDLSFKRDNKYYSVFLLESTGFEDFKLKSNRLIYNLERFEKPIEIKKEIAQSNSIELNASTSILNVNTKGFNGFSTKDFNINVLHTFKESMLSIGGGISYMQSNFSASDNATYNSTNSLILDTTYAVINNLTQNYAQQIISLNGLVRLSPKIGENNLSISISPFVSIFNSLTTEISGGSITTYGKYDGISEYVYNVDELGLFSKSEELVGQRIDFNTSAYGINLGIGYQLNLKHFHIVPTLAVKYLSIQNKNNIKNSYSIDSQSYFGKFATLPKTSFISPLIGLSIIF